MCVCRDRVQPLLQSLCSGVLEDELEAAASGLLAAGAHVRAAALAALPHVPTLAEGVAPPDDIIVLLHLACHDVSETNVLMAQELWHKVRGTGKAGKGRPGAVEFITETSCRVSLKELFDW